MAKMCKACGSTDHTKFYCRSKPRTTLRRSSLHKRGKHYFSWQETRNKWLEQNKSPYYDCYLCGIRMTRSQLTLDHVKSRSRHPELRYVLSNLQPACYRCNEAKGSRDVEEL